MNSCKANLVLGNFAKKLGFGQTPLPLVGPKDQLFPFFVVEGSPNTNNNKRNDSKYVSCVYIQASWLAKMFSTGGELKRNGDSADQEFWGVRGKRSEEG